MGMDIRDYLRDCLQTWGGECREQRAWLGLVGEVGELAETFKKFLRGDFDDDVFKDRLKKELGDVIYYWVVLCYELGFDPVEVMKNNIDKLADRQRRGVINGDGDER